MKRRVGSAVTPTAASTGPRPTNNGSIFARGRGPYSSAEQHQAGLGGHVEPLARVRRHRIRGLDSREEVSAPLGRHGRAAIGGVHVEPKPTAFTNLGDGAEIARRSDRRRTRLSHDAEGTRAPLRVFDDGFLRPAGIDPTALVGPDPHHVVRSQPEQPRGAIDRDATLFRDADPGRPVRIPPTGRPRRHRVPRRGRHRRFTDPPVPVTVATFTDGADEGGTEFEAACLARSIDRPA